MPLHSHIPKIFMKNLIQVLHSIYLQTIYLGMFYKHYFTTLQISKNKRLNPDEIFMKLFNKDKILNESLMFFFNFFC